MKGLFCFVGSHKVFLRLLMNLCFEILVIVLVTGNLIYWYFYNALQEDAYRYNIELLKQTKQVTEVVLTEIEKTAFSLALNKDVQRSVVLPWDMVNDYPVLKNVNYMFNDKIASSSYIYSIYLYSSKAHKVITNSGIIEFEDFRDKKVIDDFRRKKASLQWRKTRKLSNGTESMVDVITFLMNVPINDYSNSGVLVINLNEDMLYNTIVNINNRKLGNVAILGPDGSVISSRKKTMLYQHLGDMELGNKINEQEEGYFIHRENGISEFICYINSDYNGWKYIAINSYNQVFEKSIFVLQVTLMISGICLVVGLLLSLFVSSRYYTPIQGLITAISNHIDENSLKAETGQSKDFKDEFSYIRGSIEKIMEQNKEFREKFVQNEMILKDNFLLNLILGRNMEVREIYSQFVYYNIDLEINNFIVAVIRVYDNDEIGSEWEKKRNILRYQIRLLCEGIINMYCKGVVVDRGRQRFVLILNFSHSVDKDTASQQSKEIALRIRGSIKKELGLDTSIGIGSLYKNATDIHISYNEALEALRYERIAGRRSIISIEDVMVDQGNRREIVDFESHRAEIVNELKLGNGEVAFNLLSQIFDKIIENKLMSFQHKNVMLMELVNCIIIAIIEINGNLDDIFGPGCNLHYKFSQLASASRMKEWFKQVILKASSYINEKRQNKNQELIERVRRYVEEHYFECLTLDNVADSLYISRNYFCKLFKEATGKTFGEFLMEVRVEKASALLRETGDNIVEIAQKTGFGNKQNIIRAFKKNIGMTPTQYRNLHVQQVIEKQLKGDM